MPTAILASVICVTAHLHHPLNSVSVHVVRTCDLPLVKVLNRAYGRRFGTELVDQYRIHVILSNNTDKDVTLKQKTFNMNTCLDFVIRMGGRTLPTRRYGNIHINSLHVNKEYSLVIPARGMVALPASLYGLFAPDPPPVGSYSLWAFFRFGGKEIASERISFVVH